MTRDDINKLIAHLPQYDKHQRAATTQELHRLIEIAVAAERERCAGIADQYSAPLVAAKIRA